MSGYTIFKMFHPHFHPPPPLPVAGIYSCVNLMLFAICAPIVDGSAYISVETFYMFWHFCRKIACWRRRCHSWIDRCRKCRTNTKPSKNTSTMNRSKCLKNTKCTHRLGNSGVPYTPGQQLHMFYICRQFIRLFFNLMHCRVFPLLCLCSIVCNCQ